MARHPFYLKALLPLPLALGLVACGALVRGTYPEAQVDVEAAGVVRPIDIYLDSLGVPHIYAQDAEDGAYAVGFLHARDRRFQMELLRLAAQGRLTELLGEDLLKVDRRLRILTYNVDATLKALPPRDKATVRAYVKGVNYGTEINPTPLEFKLLKYTPEPWTETDVLAVARLQSWDLSVDAGREMARDRITAIAPESAHEWLTLPSPHLGTPIVDPESVADQRPSVPPLPAPPSGIPLISKNEASPESPASAPAEALAKATRQERPALTKSSIIEGVLEWTAGFEDKVGGSNSWAVSPKKSGGQGAALAGDPHIGLGWPVVFYEAHVHAGEWEVSGATFPGLPMVVIGRTPYVGWTLTTSYADAQDLYSLKVDPDNAMRYELDGEWVDFEPWEQSFKVGDDTITETYRVSEFGPVFNPGREESIREGRTYALSWPGFEAEGTKLTEVFHSIYGAKEVDEAISAIRSLNYPSQNWMLATADGHIAYVLGGKLPERRASPLPQDGTRRDTMWSGFMTEADRPVVVDPPEGFLVAANQPVSPDATRFNYYGSGAYRSMSISSRLRARDGWTTDQLRGLQVDLANGEAAHLTGPILEILGSHDFSDLPDDRYARVQKMMGVLKAWDFRMDADLAAPLIYENLRAHMMSALFTPWVGEDDAYQKYAELRISEAPYYHALLTKDGARYWDDPNTDATETREGRIARALMAAEVELSASFGSDIDKWTWGDAHQLALKHPFASKRILQPIFGLDPIPAPGGRHTIYALDHLGVLGDFTVTSGPVIRQVVAPGQEAGFVLAGGNAGQPKHPNSLNQLDAWLVGEQHRVGSNRGAIESSAVGHIKLSPKGSK